MRNKPIEIGDLVRFDAAHQLGIVVAKRRALAFLPEEKVTDLKVLWSDGEAFWCLDFTLSGL